MGSQLLLGLTTEIAKCEQKARWHTESCIFSPNDVDSLLWCKMHSKVEGNGLSKSQPHVFVRKTKKQASLYTSYIVNWFNLIKL